MTSSAGTYSVSDSDSKQLLSGTLLMRWGLMFGCLTCEGDSLSTSCSSSLAQVGMWVVLLRAVRSSSVGRGPLVANALHVTRGMFFSHYCFVFLD